MMSCKTCDFRAAFFPTCQNIELQVQLASLKKELSEKDALLLQAK